MKLKLKDLKPNPFKQYINKGNLSESRLEVMRESIAHGTLPEHFTARKNNDVFELTSGHHRHGALVEAKGDDYEVEASIVGYNNEQMLVDMVRENLTQRNNDYRDVADSAVLAKRWLEGEVFKGTLRTSHSQPKKIGSPEIAKFLSKEGKAISHTQIAKYIKIEEQAIPEIKDSVVKGIQGHTDENKLGIEISAKLATFEKDEQKELMLIIKNLGLSEEKIIKGLTRYKDSQDFIKERVRANDNVVVEKMFTANTDEAKKYFDNLKKTTPELQEKIIETDLEADDVIKIVEFKEPEQQEEILDLYEQKHEEDNELFGDVVDKYKKIADGEKPLEMEEELSPELVRFNRLKEKCEQITFMTPATIKKIPEGKVRNDMIDILKTTENHIHKLLVALEAYDIIE